MIVFSRLRMFGRWILRRKAAEEEMKQELDFFVDAFAADRMRDGATPEEARRLARLELGGVDQTRERIRSIRWSAPMEQVWQDLLHGLRFLRRTPAFAAVAVMTLALGIGATTAIFALVNGILLRPLPYSEPDRIVSVWTRYVPSSGYDFPQFQLSGPEFVDYRTQTKALSEVAAFVRGGMTFSISEDSQPLNVLQALGTANLFATLGTQAAIGRTFLPGDDRPGAACVAVLSHGLWTEVFGGDPDAVGASIRVESPARRVPCEIVGVMPPSFVFPDA